jgi:hypothetical protein
MFRKRAPASSLMRLSSHGTMVIRNRSIGSALRVLASFIVLLLTGSGASAATLNVVGGQLLGASGVDVGGTLYTVEFLQDSCIALYDGCDSPSDFTFPTPGEALSASLALLDQVFIDGVSGNFDSVPSLTVGCENYARCDAFTPYRRDSTLVSAAAARNVRPGFGNDSTFGESYPATNNGDLNDTAIYAVWTLVPEPGTAVLMGLGLLAMGVRARLEI